MRRGVSDLFSPQDSTPFSSCTTQTSIVCSPFGQLLTPECGSHAVLPRVEPGPFPETQTLTITRVCHYTLGLALRFLTHSLDLTPFWNSQTGFWESSETTTTSTLKYTYPEFNNLPSDPTSIRNAIGAIINQKYGGGGSFFSGGPVSFLAQAPAGGAPAQPAQAPPAATPATSAPAPAAAGTVHPFASRGGPPHTAVHPGPGQAAPHVIQDWTVRIHFKKYELRQSFAVLIFLGDVPADASQWRTSPNFVGSHVAFVNTSAEQCANCREQADLVAEGFVHLNSTIAKRSGLSSFNPDVVTPYLQKNLHWRVQAVRSFCASVILSLALITLP